MRQSLVDFSGFNIQYIVGSAEMMPQLQMTAAKIPFDADTIDFLSAVSRKLLTDSEAKQYPDVVTLAFWMRKASLQALKSRFDPGDASVVRLGRGIVFHIAPSNVPVNYAYSLVTGLLCGNKNIVRIPSKDFVQVRIINRAIQEALEEREAMKPYICLVRYSHDTEINDAFSAIADVRVVWGGDETIKELRRSPMGSRATEITFADRYSLAVIDADDYLAVEDKAKTANDFFNDSYLTDQNACTSPRAVVWIGEKTEQARAEFWRELHELLSRKYEITGVQAVSKLTSGYMLAAVKDNVQKVSSEDNLIVRMLVPELTADLMDLKDNSGYFFEYVCRDILEIKDFCNDTKCQTIAYLGDREMFRPLVLSGVSGIDRIVPVGRTMDFDLIWDGYQLVERLTRTIAYQ